MNVLLEMAYNSIDFFTIGRKDGFGVIDLWGTV